MPHRLEASMAMLIELHQDHNRELREINKSLGSVEQQLAQGAEVHASLRHAVTSHGNALRDLHVRTATLERERKAQPKKEPVSLSDWTEFLKAFWPYLFAVSALTAKLLLGSAAPVTQLLTNLTAK